ncbi:type II toxin-antitoxin system RelE/ParE family toxin [Marivirga lumbricoides]|uniref:Type II toxin-antitoxin system RelE/ParE family toxin n=1 Tax=Marivirga lumbricoides TaxID=1046115 RepID=A0A2T4DQB6_9BACT|nr:type II toxin-antitoxin system RelE/ParE family toxin [Marivirga lumbricoides]
MSKPIEWSPRARQDYLKLLDYLADKWGNKTVNKFNNRLQSILKLISEMPDLYPSSDKRKQVRRCVISKQTSLYYQIKKDKIELITMFDNRQNPTKKKL